MRCTCCAPAICPDRRGKSVWLGGVRWNGRYPLPMSDAYSVVLPIVSCVAQRFMRRPRNFHNFNVIIVLSF